MAVLPRGSYLKGRAVLKRYTLEQSEEPLLTCARIRGTSLRSCIQCSQGLATACNGCSGLGRHQSAEECIPAPSQVGSLQGAKVTVLGLVYLPFLRLFGPITGPGRGVFCSQYAEVYPLFLHSCNTLMLVGVSGACRACTFELLLPNVHDLAKALSCVQASTHTRAHW